MVIVFVACAEAMLRAFVTFNAAPSVITCDLVAEAFPVVTNELSVTAGRSQVKS